MCFISGSSTLRPKRRRDIGKLGNWESPLESYKVSAGSELDAEDEASKETFERLEWSEGCDATDGVREVESQLESHRDSEERDSEDPKETESDGEPVEYDVKEEHGRTWLSK